MRTLHISAKKESEVKMFIKKYKDVEIHFSETSENFYAEVNGDTCLCATIKGVQEQIDRCLKVKFQRIETYKQLVSDYELSGHNAGEFVKATITSINTETNKVFYTLNNGKRGNVRQQNNYRYIKFYEITKENSEKIKEIQGLQEEIIAIKAKIRLLEQQLDEVDILDYMAKGEIADGE